MSGGSKKHMKKIAVWLCVMLLWISACLGEGAAWTPEAWRQVQDAVDAEEDEPVPEAYRIRAERPDRDPAKRPQDGWLRILVMGVTSPDIQHNYGRLGALALVCVNLNSGEVRMLSLPEYALIRLEELPDSIQLKHVNCFGGPLLTLREVSRVLQTDIPLYCALNLNAFIKLIDSLGGVTLTLTEAEALILNAEPGVCAVSGEQALAYIRIRQEGDGGARAQKLIRALVSQTVQQRSVSTLFSVADQLIKALDTNLSLMEMVDISLAVLGQNPSVGFVSRAVPVEADGALGDAAVQVCRAFLAQDRP